MLTFVNLFSKSGNSECSVNLCEVTKSVAQSWQILRKVKNMNIIQNYGISDKTTFGMKKSLKPIEMIQRKAHNLNTNILPNERGYVEAKLAEFIGKLNGQSNIQSGSIYLDVKPLNELWAIPRQVAFITEKKKNGIMYDKFKGKDAIIIDPINNITDFAGNYFLQLRKKLSHLPKFDFVIIPNKTEKHNQNTLRLLRLSNPELVIKGYQPIKTK